MSLVDPSDSIVVTSIAFGEGNVEIGYLEKREQQDTVGMMRTLFIDTRGARVDGLVQEIREIVVEVVDKALLAMRNPEQSIDPRKRFRNRPAPVEEDDEKEEE